VLVIHFLSLNKQLLLSQGLKNFVSEAFDCDTIENMVAAQNELI